MKRVVVHVGKLVLHGLPPGKERGIGAAVERAVAGRLGGPIGKAVRGPIENAIGGKTKS